MPLNWDATRCAEKDFILGEDPDGYRVTEAIIFSLMDVGMRGVVTEGDVEEFVTRTAEIAVVRGATMLQQIGEDGTAVDRSYALEQVRQRIGLTTNVGPMSRRQFAAKLVRMARERARR